MLRKEYLIVHRETLTQYITFKRGGEGSLYTLFLYSLATRVGIEKPTQKNPLKKTHLKKPTKNVFFWVFWVFFNFLFFMKIIQTFLFQTDFLWTNK